MGNIHESPLIDTNRRRGIVHDILTFNRKQGIIIREIVEILLQSKMGNRVGIFNTAPRTNLVYAQQEL